MKPRIALDITPLQRSSSFRGIGRFVSSLVTSLHQLPEAAAAEWFLVKHPGSTPLDGLFPVIVVPDDASAPVALARELTSRSIMLYQNNELLVPRGAQGVAVLTVIYDLIPIVFAGRNFAPMMRADILLQSMLPAALPGVRILTRIAGALLPVTFFSRIYGLHLARRFRKSFTRMVSDSAYFLHISQSTMDDFHRCYPNARRNNNERVVLLGCETGADTSLREPDAPGYFLYVGGYDFRKNVDGLIRMFARSGLAAQGMRLILAGRMKELRRRSIETDVRELGLGGTVILEGFVDDARLAHLMSGATAFTFSSLYEGFGLPVLEAMAAGAPVIAFRNSSIPEVAGDAAMLAGTEDEFIAAMRQLASDTALRRNYIGRGLKQARRFSWSDAAAATFAFHKQILEEYAHRN
jgi:glycosyltransferase involved in cell wall biosynthesis